MSEFIERMYSLDQNIFVLVAMMCVWATLILNKALDHTIITIIALPTFLHFSLASIVVLEDNRVWLADERSINLILLAGIGIIVALISMVAMFVAYTTYVDMRDRLAKERHAKDLEQLKQPSWVGRT